MARSMRLTILLLCGTAIAGTFEQSDWSGGPYMEWPVREWGDEFSSDSGVDCLGAPGTVGLHHGAADHDVDTDFGVYRVLVADLDGDGDGDVAATSLEGDIAWWENLDGAGTQWEVEYVTRTFAYAYSLQDGDMDGDGDPDLVCTSATTNRVGWFENPAGPGGSWSYRHVGSVGDPQCVRVGDPDGDGDPDIVTISWDDGLVLWFENTSGYGDQWTRRPIGSGMHRPSCVHADDLDGDGDLDVLTSAGYGQTWWWENRLDEGPVVEWVEHPLPGCPVDVTDIRSGDIDGDGDVDVVLVGMWDTLAWWENPGATGGEWLRHDIAPDLKGCDAMDLADLDGDGDLDIASIAVDPNQVEWWENTGSATPWERHVVEHYFHATDLDCGDVDGDGIDEMAGGYCYRDLVRWFDLVDGYPAVGALTSSLLYAGGDPEYVYLDCAADMPPGTSVSFLLRSSDDWQEMGAWSDTLGFPGIVSGVLERGDSYIQYRLLMTTEDPSVTPRVDAVEVGWLGMGIGTAMAPLLEGEGLLVGPSPSSGEVTALFRAPAGLEVTLSVYDTAGRLAATIGPVSSGPGRTVVPLGSFPAGRYTCLLRGDGLRERCAFTTLQELPGR